MSEAIALIVSFVLIYGVCWALHQVSLYLDFEHPAKAEAKHKQKLERRFKIISSTPNTVLGLRPWNQSLLEQRAKMYADNMIESFKDELTEDKKKELYDYYYNYYIEKHSLQY